MAGELIASVAHWLAEQPPHRNHHELADVLRGLGRTAQERRSHLEAVRAAAELLDIAGLCVVYHGSVPAIAVQHRDALQRVAAGDAITEVARDIEPRRPLTITRIQINEFAAWYRSALRLPVGAVTTGHGGGLGATPDAALAALRDNVARRLSVTAR